MKHLKFLEGINHTQQQELLTRLKVEWTYTSNALEGNTISLGDTQFIIEYGLTIKGKSIQEHNEVIGHARAIDLVYDLLDKETLKKSDIFNLHKAVQTQVVVDIYSPIGEWKNESNGRYIKQNERLIYQSYPKPEHIEYLMQLWVAEFNTYTKLSTQEEALNAYTRLHLAFTSIHPFFDGNGRMARLFANIPLLKNGFLPIVINNQYRQEYLEALSEYDLSTSELNNQTTHFIVENEAFDKLKTFFKTQYPNTLSLLNEIKMS
ncbi:MAG: Fic family protein [Candidatus Parabeggiatoa sp. nov. 3]|nr:MAG: Fic family protein [Gammaproteobacteria bacterium]RKZ61199.1 MAG: Fic family protein [Gammaproteobacteria bacterium]RKZ84073.1 MAG: Fic family protein [Gammaproteobacteria bacterium]